MKFLVLKELYLTFLTRNDSYMQKVPTGTVLESKNGDLYLDGQHSIDGHYGYWYHGYIEEIDG